jgi:hypothetical protein
MPKQEREFFTPPGMREPSGALLFEIRYRAPLG